MRYVLFLILLIKGSFALADPSKQPLAGIDGSVRVADRYTVTKDGKSSDQLRQSLTINGFLNIDPDGCYQVRARVLTGDSYTAENITYNVDSNTAPKLAISVRNLYISMKCLAENVRVELGALTPSSGSDYTGNLGLTASGWVDGIRVIVTDKEHNREWIFSAGQSANPKITSAFKRPYDDVNLAQVTVRQKYAQIGKALENATVFLSAAAHEKNIYLRAGIQAAVHNFGKWIGSDEASLIAGAEMFGSDKGMIAEMIHSEFDLKKWKARATFAHVRKDPSDQLRTSMMLKSYMAYGNNAYFNVTRVLDDEDSLEWNVMFRIGDAGKMIETGLTKKFCMKNQCTVNRPE